MLPFFIGAYHLSYAAAAGLVLAQTLFSSVAQPSSRFRLWSAAVARRLPIGLSFAGLGVALMGLYAQLCTDIRRNRVERNGYLRVSSRSRATGQISRRGTRGDLDESFHGGRDGGLRRRPPSDNSDPDRFRHSRAMLLAVPVVIMSLAATYQLPRLAAERVPRHRGGARSVAVESREQWSAFARLTVVVMLRSIVFFGPTRSSLSTGLTCCMDRKPAAVTL